jgi:excisionase family DNA binding protein
MVGCGRATIYRLLKLGKLRSVQVGGLRRIPADEAQRLGLIATAEAAA